MTTVKAHLEAVLLGNGRQTLRKHPPVVNYSLNSRSVSEALPSLAGPGRVLVGSAVRLHDGGTVSLFQYRLCRRTSCAHPWRNQECPTVARVSCPLPYMSVPRQPVAELMPEIASSISVINSVEIASKFWKFPGRIL